MRRRICRWCEMIRYIEKLVFVWVFICVSIACESRLLYLPQNLGRLIRYSDSHCVAISDRTCTDGNSLPHTHCTEQSLGASQRKDTGGVIKTAVQIGLVMSSTFSVSLPSASAIKEKERLGYNPRNERIYDTYRKSFLPAHPEDFLTAELERGGRQIVVVGEVHSNPCHHHAEFEILRTLQDCYGSPDPFDTKDGVAIGLECFYRQHQKALDSFIFEHQNIGKLKAQTNWKETWGFDLNYYAKIFKYAAQHKIRLVGLNIPIGVVQLVGEAGLQSLPESLRVLLPKIDLSNINHRKQFVGAISGGGSVSHPSLSEERMQYLYEAQTLWEEYMSETCANYVKNYPGQKLMVIAGVGHVQGRYGIPDRIQARTGAAPFVIVPQVVEWSEDTGLPRVDKPLSYADGDWGWYTEQELLP